MAKIITTSPMVSTLPKAMKYWSDNRLILNKPIHDELEKEWNETFNNKHKKVSTC